MKDSSKTILKSTVQSVSKILYTVVAGVIVNVKDAREYDYR